MPTISMFYGIIIRMYYAPGGHNPPHFHACYNEYTATIALDTLEILNGNLPRKQLHLVQAWAELHSDELWANWKLAMNGETPYKRSPEVIGATVMVARVPAVQATDDFKLILTFDHLECGVFDMRPHLTIGHFAELRDVKLFRQVGISFDTVE